MPIVTVKGFASTILSGEVALEMEQGLAALIGQTWNFQPEEIPVYILDTLNAKVPFKIAIIIEEGAFIATQKTLEERQEIAQKIGHYVHGFTLSKGLKCSVIETRVIKFDPGVKAVSLFKCQ